MTTNNNKYSNAKIYKLVNDLNDNIYIGSTCNTLPYRLGGHKTNAKNNPERFVYKQIEEIGGFEHIKIILIEHHPCNSKEELEQRERYWIEELKPVWNKNIPGRTNDENYKQFHLQQMKLINKIRYHTDPQYKQNQINKVMERYHRNKQLQNL